METFIKNSKIAVAQVSVTYRFMIIEQYRHSLYFEPINYCPLDQTSNLKFYFSTSFIHFLKSLKKLMTIIVSKIPTRNAAIIVTL